MINVVNPDESSTQSFSKRRLAFGLVLMSQTIFATSWRTLLSSLVLWADPDCNFLATKFSRCKMQCMNAQSFDFSFIKTYLIFHSLKKILVHQLVHQFFSFTNSKFLFTKKWTIHRVQKRWVLNFNKFISKKIQVCNFKLRNLFLIKDSLPYKSRILMVTNLILTF